MFISLAQDSHQLEKQKKSEDYKGVQTETLDQKEKSPSKPYEQQIEFVLTELKFLAFLAE